ncbi:MAG: 50S ribosomal protein L29 [Patescibacteria group bacterium]|nr:50S ribosomal protein L29 [Patescibacteria group bacterium]
MDEIRKKSRDELIKEVEKTIEELARMSVENSVNPLKDTNALHKKRKYLARIKTVLQETIQK